MSKSSKGKSATLRQSTGILGLDEILHGGFIPTRAYLVRGGPGTGKTTLGAHFLAAGAASGEKTLLITLGEPAGQILENGENVGLDLKGVTFLDLSPDSDFFTKVQTYDIFSPAEVEREPITQKIVEQVKSLKPQRIFIDSMTQFRYLASDTFQFRKQVLSCLRFLLQEGATVLFTSESSQETPDSDLQFMSDGVISLNLTDERRIVSITKFRGSDFRDGLHSMRLSSKGMEVFPKLLPRAYKREFMPEPISSGIPTLDELLHGGIERGTITLFSGPSGVGKTTIGLQFMKEAAGRGERSVVYTFEEEVEIILKRSESVNIPARAMIEQGSLSIVKIEPLQYTPDEFASIVRHEVEHKSVQIVMLDSISGYSLSMQGEDLLSYLHSLCKYLSNVGVTVILINETETLTSNYRATEAGFTYLADNLILMRYMDRHLDGRVELRKSIGVVKKRLSDFEKTLRELEITRYGIKVSQPMSGLQGIFGGDSVKTED
ncbi:MAG: ATPase domain-containing protein [Xenococcaceae cyanobacterium]